MEHDSKEGGRGRRRKEKEEWDEKQMRRRGRASFLNGENDLVLVTVTTRSKNKQRNHASEDISQRRYYSWTSQCHELFQTLKSINGESRNLKPIPK
jgi:hypothetical protein